MREWYNGYRFGDMDVYCPWDVINHCDKLRADPKTEPKAYWNNTSSNAIVKMFIDKSDKATRNDIEKLIAGEAGLGRSDIMLEDEEGEYGIVIEVKRAVKRDDMESKCEEALQQIEDRRYAEELLDEADTVWAYGIAFAEKRCCMKVKKLK